MNTLQAYYIQVITGSSGLLTVNPIIANKYEISSGVYKFYKIENNSHILVAAYPIERTIIYKIIQNYHEQE
jgi:hypothetical protein